MIGDKDYIYACEQIFFPIIKLFNPDLIIISAGFDSALGDPLGEVGVTPAGYAYMTWGLRNLCQKMAVVLEGGYDLAALERSSEAVVKTLLINPNDTEAFNSLLVELSGQGNVSYASMQAHAQANIRESFRSMASNVAKAHKKCWPSLGHLIYEKVKRRSSGMMSQNSSGSSNSPSTPITPHDFSKARTQSFGVDI